MSYVSKREKNTQKSKEKTRGGVTHIKMIDICFMFGKNGTFTSSTEGNSYKHSSSAFQRGAKPT